MLISRFPTCDLLVYIRCHHVQLSRVLYMLYGLDVGWPSGKVITVIQEWITPPTAYRVGTMPNQRDMLYCTFEQWHYGLIRARAPYVSVIWVYVIYPSPKF